jgi:thiosulfate reductase cytochrome b subunit
MAEPRLTGTRESRWIYRFPAIVRISHWGNALCLAVLLMSGLQIFNAHPPLYWGEDSDFARPLFSISTDFTEDGDPVGVTTILGWQIETTGVLGWSRLDGRPVQRAFPAWSTIPSARDLATGRVWHLFFAWVFVVTGTIYLVYSIASRHFTRDLVSRPATAVHYSLPQRFAYLVVILILALWRC